MWKLVIQKAALHPGQLYLSPAHVLEQRSTGTTRFRTQSMHTVCRLQQLIPPPAVADPFPTGFAQSKHATSRVISPTTGSLHAECNTKSDREHRTRRALSTRPHPSVRLCG